jgi:hypothetical protein
VHDVLAPPRRPLPRPGLARGAALLALVGAVPLSFLLLALTTPGAADEPDGGASWLLFLVVPLLQVTGAVLLLAGRSWLFLAVACLPGAAMMALLFLVSGPDLSLFLGSLGQLALTAVTVSLAVHREVRDWVADRATRSTGGRRGEAVAR